MIGRREFLARAGGACAALALPGEAQAASLGLVFVAPFDGEVNESAAQGVQLGVEEAARTGALMGRRVELRTTYAPSDALVKAWRPAALIGGFSARRLREGVALAETAGIPFLNVAVSHDSLRGEGCHPLLFHVAASEAMLADARRGSPTDTVAALWHPSLERFGAAQLNDRFRARFRAGMDGAAWAGWMAVRMLWEASLRARSTEPAAILAYLGRESTQFDGQKGWPLSFRAWDHQLRQPLYLVRGDTVVGEVPTRQEPEERSSRELLDRLGASSTNSTCQRIRGGS